MSIEKNSFHFGVPKSRERQPDPLLGLERKFEEDSNSEKINAGVGVYVDDEGKEYMPPSVKSVAEKVLMESPGYLNPKGEEEFLGDRRFILGTANLFLGEQAEDILAKRKLAAAGTPGGTAALALMADVLSEISPESQILIGVPAYPNHEPIFKERGIKISYFDHTKNRRYYHASQIDAISKASEGSVILLHGGKTHNPTGVNPNTQDEWREIAQAVRKKNSRVFMDVPYAGFGEGFKSDIDPIGVFLEEDVPIAIAVSYSKNMGLYKERVGALLVPAKSQENALQLQRVINAKARVNWSTPPSYGERIAINMLSDGDLMRKLDQEDLARQRDKLKERRELIVQTSPEDSYIQGQLGLFSLMDILPDEVRRLQEEHSIYMPNSGRVNIGGIPTKDIPRFGEAIRQVRSNRRD